MYLRRFIQIIIYEKFIHDDFYKCLQTLQMSRNVYKYNTTLLIRNISYSKLSHNTNSKLDIFH